MEKYNPNEQKRWTCDFIGYCVDSPIIGYKHLRVRVRVTVPLGILQFLPKFGKKVCVPVQIAIGNRTISGHSEGIVMVIGLDVSDLIGGR